MTTLPNVWHLRRVADTAAKACLICHKPSSSVLITPNNKEGLYGLTQSQDYFYVCPVHLKDRHFCSPIIDAEEEAAKKKAEAMAREIEKVKKEFEEKQQRKKEKEKEKEKKKDDPKDDKDKDEDDSKKVDDKEEKERDDKIDAIKSQSTSTSDDSPRIFALHKNFYQMRIDRMRNIEAAKRNRQRLQDPSFFPSVPSGGL
ncbi:VPS4-associated protein 1 [Aspergillus similis]